MAVLFQHSQLLHNNIDFAYNVPVPAMIWYIFIWFETKLCKANIIIILIVLQLTQQFVFTPYDLYKYVFLCV